MKAMKDISMWLFIKKLEAQHKLGDKGLVNLL